MVKTIKAIPRECFMLNLLLNFFLGKKFSILSPVKMFRGITLAIAIVVIGSGVVCSSSKIQHSTREYSIDNTSFHVVLHNAHPKSDVTFNNSKSAALSQSPSLPNYKNESLGLALIGQNKLFK